MRSKQTIYPTPNAQHLLTHAVAYLYYFLISVPTCQRYLLVGYRVFVR